MLDTTRYKEAEKELNIVKNKRNFNADKLAFYDVVENKICYFEVYVPYKEFILRGLDFKSGNLGTIQIN